MRLSLRCKFGSVGAANLELCSVSSPAVAGSDRLLYRVGCCSFVLFSRHAPAESTLHYCTVAFFPMFSSHSCGGSKSPHCFVGILKVLQKSLRPGPGRYHDGPHP